MFGIQFSVFRIKIAAVLVVHLLSAFICSAQDTAASGAIAESEITALREELAQGARGETSVDIRRACKSVIRQAQALIVASPDAPSRFSLLEIVFQGQKRLLSLEITEQNREAIFATCAQLAEAPDEYAELRFEADMLLSERDLSLKEATIDERAAALEDMLARYRGTPAEWKSLMIGSMIASKLQEFDLEKKIQDTMFERFAGDHKVIEFRRNRNPGGEVDAVFSGTFRTASGASLTFPCDLMGHQYVLYFWSETTPKIDECLGAIKDLQAKYPGRFEVYSFNLDELPDAGQKKLRSLGLDWTPLHLPEGRRNSAYRAYPEKDPNAVFVNGQGHVLLVSPPENLGMTSVHGVTQGVLGGWNLPGIASALDDERYLAQLRSLFIGDFLVAVAQGEDQQPMPKAESKIPPEVFSAIQTCFTPPPFRYRLTKDESLENYKKAEKLCASAIKKYGKEPDIWMLRNCRIIALIGMWNLAEEPKHLKEAVAEANTVLGMELPAGADLVARFCLAKESLRNGGIDPELLLAEMIKGAGGENAPALALAAAAVLAVEANARTAHEKYSQQFLALSPDPRPWAVCAFLRDNHHRYRNFWASPGGYGFGREQKYEYRNMVAGLANPVDRRRRLQVDLKKLDGGVIRIPGDYSGEMLGVIFVEPPADQASMSNLVSEVNGFAHGFTNQGVKVVVALLSDDTNAVASLVKDADFKAPVGMLPDGLRNPLVQKLGILSADRIGNPLLLRPDGAIGWMISGLEYRAFGDRAIYAIGLAVVTNVEKVRSDAGFEALEKGDFREALKLFENYSPIQKVRGDHTHTDWWVSDRLQGRALAHMGLKEWDKALPLIDAAIERRVDDFKSAICKCHGLVEMYLTKAMILEHLDKGREAKIAIAKAKNERLPHSKLPPGNARGGVPVGVYYDLLKQVRLSLEEPEAGK